MSNPIIQPALAIKSLRHTQYKNTAYAVAELIDNAVQAGASRVELICLEDKTLVTEREMYRLQEIAVLDNGCGMDKPTLARALEIGNGTRLDPASQTGIGRFGMGLPMASITQCKRVDIWTWQNGIESAIHSYLDLGEIEHEGITEVPEPRREEPPARLQSIGRQTLGKTGTLVRWKFLDKCQWTTADPLFRHGGELIGRIYRRPLAAKTVAIRFVRSREGVGFGAGDEQYVLPNDPLYLTTGTSCPAPFADNPMFEPWGTPKRVAVKLSREGSDGKSVPVPHEVIIRFAMAKHEARIPTAANPFTGVAGNTPYGKHAARNTGVSLMRANRELDLDEGLVSRHSPAPERWWGVDVEFPPALDEVFGVTHTKQSASHFSALTRSLDIDELDTENDLKRMKAEREGYLSAHLFDVIYAVQQGIKKMREIQKNLTEGMGTTRAPQSATGEPGNTALPKPTPETIGTQVVNERKNDGYVGGSDADETKPVSVRISETTKGLKDLGVHSDRAEADARNIVNSGTKFGFSYAALGSSAFFAVRSAGGNLIIVLNTDHLAYDKLINVLAGDAQHDSPDVLRERLADASDALKLLFEAWARYEDELPVNGGDQRAARKVREGWGSMAEAFLAEG